MKAKVHKSKIEYWSEILELYRRVADVSGGLARTSQEITEEYVKGFLRKSYETGLSLTAIDGMKIVGEIHAYNPGPKVFSHVLSELTVVVHPDYQGDGVGRILFAAFLTEIETRRSDILRVELIARESNQRAIGFYQSIGFASEGRLEKRVNRRDGTFEADIPMAWINPGFKNSKNHSN